MHVEIFREACTSIYFILWNLISPNIEHGAEIFSHFSRFDLNNMYTDFLYGFWFEFA